MHKFPAGELLVRADKSNLLDLSNKMSGKSDDIINILMQIDAKRRILGDIPIYVYMPYFPYARQDKVFNYGEANGFQVIVDLLTRTAYSNNVYFIVADLHTDYPLDDRFIQIKQIDIIKKYYKEITDVCGDVGMIVSPDKGALNKSIEIGKYLSTEVLTCNKERNPKTGEILSLTTNLTKIKDGLNLLVVDDICDGGSTFIFLAKELREKFKNINSLNLYVTHGIFSKGTQELQKYYDNIVLFNVVPHEENNVYISMNPLEKVLDYKQILSKILKSES